MHYVGCKVMMIRAVHPLPTANQQSIKNIISSEIYNDVKG